MAGCQFAGTIPSYSSETTYFRKINEVIIRLFESIYQLLRLGLIAVNTEMVLGESLNRAGRQLEAHLRFDEVDVKYSRLNLDICRRVRTDGQIRGSALRKHDGSQLPCRGSAT